MKKKIILPLIIVLFLGGIVLAFEILKFNKNKKIIVKDNISGNLKTIEVATSSTIKDIVPEKIEGYAFVSWLTEDGKEIDDSKLLISDTQIYAVYVPVSANYIFEEWNNFGQTHEITISDKSVLEVVEEALPNEENIDGGTNYQYTVKGLKEGKGTVTIEIKNSDGIIELSKTYYFNIDNDLYIYFEKMEHNMSNNSPAADVDYVFTEWNSFAQTHKINISDKSILTVDEKIFPSLGKVFSGGINYQYTVKGLKEGKSIVTIEVINSEETIELSKDYYFIVDSELNVHFEKVESNIDNSNSNSIVGDTYVFTEWNSFAQTHKINISDKSILEVVEETLPNEENIDGGTNYQYTVKGLKEGKGTITIKIKNSDDTVEINKTYYFSVDNDLNVKFERMIDNLSASSTEYIFTEWDSLVQTHNIIISDKNILKVEEEALSASPLSNRKSMVNDGTTYQYTIKGIKEGKGTITLEIKNSSGTLETSRTYYFNVDSNLNIKFERVINNM